MGPAKNPGIATLENEAIAFKHSKTSLKSLGIEDPKILLSGQIIDALEEDGILGQIFIVDSETKDTLTIGTQPDGSFATLIDPNKEYSVGAVGDGFQFTSKYLNTNLTLEAYEEIDFVLMPLNIDRPKIVLSGQLVDAKNENGIPGQVYIVDIETNDTLIIDTQADGSYTAMVDADKEYSLGAVGEGFQFRSKSLTTNLKKYDAYKKLKFVLLPLQTDDQKVLLSGQIMGEEGEAGIPGKIIIMDPESGDTLNVIDSQEDGTYAVSLDVDEEYSVGAESEGFQFKTQSLKTFLNMNGYLDLDFILIKSKEFVTANDNNSNADNNNDHSTENIELTDNATDNSENNTVTDNNTDNETNTTDNSVDNTDNNPVITNFNMKNLYFGFDESKLDHVAFNSVPQVELDLLAAQLLKNPRITIELGGHADQRGAASYNMALSLKRAEIAKKYLVNKGVDASRIKTVGYGETTPEVSQAVINQIKDIKKREEAYQRNRRTVVKILTQ